MTIIAVAIASFVWTVTYYRDAWGYRLRGACLFASGFPRGSGVPGVHGSSYRRRLEVKRETPWAYKTTYLRPKFERESVGLVNVVMPLWLPLAVLSVPTFIVWWRGRRARTVPGYCIECGYDLTGNVSGKCSECGAVVLEVDAGTARRVNRVIQPGERRQ